MVGNRKGLFGNFLEKTRIGDLMIDIENSNIKINVWKAWGCQTQKRNVQYKEYIDEQITLQNDFLYLHKSTLKVSERSLLLS